MYPQYDELVAQSGSESDPAARADLMHRAEQLAVGEQFYIIPLYAMKSVNLVNPEVTGSVRSRPAGHWNTGMRISDKKGEERWMTNQS